MNGPKAKRDWLKEGHSPADSSASTESRRRPRQLTSGVTNLSAPRDTADTRAVTSTGPEAKTVASGCALFTISLPGVMDSRRAVDASNDYQGREDLHCPRLEANALVPPSRHCLGRTNDSGSYSSEGLRFMGNSSSLPEGGVLNAAGASRSAQHSSGASARPRRSNLTALLEPQDGIGLNADSDTSPNTSSRGFVTSPAPGRSILKRQPHVYEADSASGPVQTRDRASLRLDSPSPLSTPSSCPSRYINGIARRSSWSETPLQTRPSTNAYRESESVRRCISSKELRTLVPPSGSPYAYMLYRKEILEVEMQQRLMAVRESVGTSRSFTPSPAPQENSSMSDESRRKSVSNGRLTNEARNRRRAEHSRAVIRDLCDIVTDLFVAESKLLNPSNYGVQSSLQRDHVFRSVQQFLAALPPRYALGVETPSEVLLHMRLMAAARSNDSRAVVHIVNHESEKTTAPSHTRPQSVTRLVTIACKDARGLLEYITNTLSTGGSRVIDADVMLTSDNIVLDRFVVEMNGRLRLDKLANGIEAFLKQAQECQAPETPTTYATEAEPSATAAQTSGPVYFHPPSPDKGSPREIEEEMMDAVPLSQVLASNSSINALVVPTRGQHQRNIRQHSLPNPPGHISSQSRVEVSPYATSDKSGSKTTDDAAERTQESSSQRYRPPLVNREASDFSGMGLDNPEGNTLWSPVDGLEQRTIPLIPFEELMLIETLGTGRVSTIYRAAWQHNELDTSLPSNVKMVALKVASVNPDTGDTSHVDELRREADIAGMLQHTNVCDLLGVAADSECFCLAYEYCEGGSLLSLLLDTTRYYEYLPIALDIANGMAYLHHRHIIHRDLKPSNVLLSMDHRAKIADFGMSATDTGQELTAETGTYRYMAPEVIKHESYSSNADVYSFGIVLWQLITREVPFATMTPIQAAWAVAEGRRPEIPASMPKRLKEIVCACWDQDSHKRPSFTYIAMALADYAKMAFSPANVGAQTLQIANEMLANVQGNATVNVDFSTPVATGDQTGTSFPRNSWFGGGAAASFNSNVGLEI